MTTTTAWPVRFRWIVVAILAAGVFAHGGTVTKIMGDSLQVLFGAPDDQLVSPGAHDQTSPSGWKLGSSEPAT